LKHLLNHFTEYAAAFFLLGGSPKDAINICLKQLNDFQLAVALARVVEGSNDGPLLQDVLTRAVLPTAFELGNRYLASWAFWLLHRRDLSVRILVVSPIRPEEWYKLKEDLVDTSTRYCSGIQHQSG